jgi:hypothetical protein
MAWIENGVWKPWRHPDYRVVASELQGWWRNPHTGDVLAVLAEAESPSGKAAVRAARYNFNIGSRGTGLLMLRTTLERNYVREPDDLDPREHGHSPVT